MLKNYPLIILASCLILSGSCTKKGQTGPAGPAGAPGPSYKGAITGHVRVYDQYGSEMYSGLNNIQLTLQGTQTTTADANGYFAFTNVSTGDYTISATAPGLAATVASNVGFIKDSVFMDIKMSALPQFNITSFAAYHNPGSAYDSLIITTAADSRARNCIIFVNNTPAVSNVPGTYKLVYIKPLPYNGWPVTIIVKIPAADLNNANMFYNQMVYYAVASYVVNDASVYSDHATGQSVYNAIGTLLADSTTCP